MKKMRVILLGERGRRRERERKGERGGEERDGEGGEGD